MLRNNVGLRLLATMFKDSSPPGKDYTIRAIESHYALFNEKLNGCFIEHVFLELNF